VSSHSPFEEIGLLQLRLLHEEIPLKMALGKSGSAIARPHSMEVERRRGTTRRASDWFWTSAMSPAACDAMDQTVRRPSDPGSSAGPASITTRHAQSGKAQDRDEELPPDTASL
jgi:hypothetical protein